MPVSYLNWHQHYSALVPHPSAHAYMIVPVGAIVGGIGAAIVLLTLLTLSLHTWHRKRVHDAVTQCGRVDQFKMSPHVPSQHHFYPSSSSYSAPFHAGGAGQGHFQQPLPVIREPNSTPSRPNPMGKGLRVILEPPKTHDDIPPAYYVG